MAYTPHYKVKPEKLADSAVGYLDQELTTPKLFTPKSVDDFKGARDDTLNMKVEGFLRAHEYGWRNDRSQPLVVDQYTERTISVTFGGDAYNAIELSDEQKEFDFEGWQPLVQKQARAVGRHLQYGAHSTLVDADYNVVIGEAAKNLRASIIEARRVLNAWGVPVEDRYLLVGPEFEAALLNEGNLTLTDSVAQGRAESALAEATLGRLFGFRVIVDQLIKGTKAFAFSGSGFVFLNAAPHVPISAPYGATSSFEGISLRLLQDYDHLYTRDRSIVNTWYGFREVEDVVVVWDEDGNDGRGEEIALDDEYLLRGIALDLEADSEYPEADSDLGKFTDVSEESKWPTGFYFESGDGGGSGN